jgi:uncharacterized membrane protein (DUF485 family)
MMILVRSKWREQKRRKERFGFVRSGIVVVVVVGYLIIIAEGKWDGEREREKSEWAVSFACAMIL